MQSSIKKLYRARRISVHTCLLLPPEEIWQVSANLRAPYLGEESCGQRTQLMSKSKNSNEDAPKKGQKIVGTISRWIHGASHETTISQQPMETNQSIPRQNDRNRIKMDNLLTKRQSEDTWT